MVIGANPRDRRRSPPEGTDRLPRFFVHVYRLVAQVPKGKVVTYGQVAALLGAPRAARAVGTALRYLPGSLTRTVPWQRVINAAGGISLQNPSVESHGRVSVPARTAQLGILCALPLLHGGRGRKEGRSLNGTVWTIPTESAPTSRSTAVTPYIGAPRRPRPAGTACRRAA